MELMQAIISGLPRGTPKFTLRSTCKSLSRSLALSCSSVVVRRAALARRSGGAKQEVIAALAAFPNARRCVIRLEEGHSRRQSAFASNSAASLLESNLLSEALKGLHGRNITALTVTGLSFTVPEHSSECWAPLLESVQELELGDVSHTVAADQGAFNALLHGQHLRTRSDALVALAVSFPNLRRLSLSAACFSAESLEALHGLSKLESLSLDGSLECPGGAKQAADVYRQLLQRLPELRQLRLPQAMPACGAALEESDDEVEHEQQGEQEDEFVAASRQDAALAERSTSDLLFPLLLSPPQQQQPRSPLKQQQQPLSPRLQPPASVGHLPALPFPVSPIPPPAALVPPPLPRRVPTHRLEELVGTGIRGSVLGAFAAPLAGAIPALPQLSPLPPLPRLSMEPPMSVTDALAARASSSSSSRSGAGRILFFSDSAGSGMHKAAEQQEPPQPPQPHGASRSSATGFHPVAGGAAAAGAGAGSATSPAAPSSPAVPGPRLLRSSRKPASASLAEGFVFPRHLQDLTIPLCALNRSVFEAVCAEYGQPSAGAQAASSVNRAGALAQPQPSIGRRVLSFPYLPALGGESAARRVATVGALEAWGVEAPAGLSRPGSPAIRSMSTSSSSSSGGGSSLSSSYNNSSYPAEQDAHTTATSPAAGTSAARSRHVRSNSAESDSSFRFTGISGGSSSHSHEEPAPARRSLRSLHLPTLAGYSHWEGSFLRSARDFARLGALGDELEALHLSLELGSFRLTPDNMRACLQHLSTLRGLRELRISEAQQPTCYSARKRSCSMRGSAAFGAGGGQPGLGSLSSSSLERLGNVWPRMRSLHLFGETAVRSGGRLVVAGGWDEASLMPRACPHCAGPYSEAWRA
ncbi:hypothetical protein HXX76_007992 [Chlamydomonas incerta]|uniref:Uncharacterized protein n=1 Tax=Chlamydomonas incerta TaxID=51695 RepID=A0A835SZD9_CHLIN|nr:hypothetical protein HXX76_007992 [Chlamydomonas incerta]|eukprot:KAG2434267.1 hypothetical protein HXX76_007992 [Chlamydomonas incerta]